MRGWTRIHAVFLFLAMGATASPAQVTLSTLADFLGGTNGTNPNPLTQGLDGNFYGTTRAGGDNGQGTIFKVTPLGTLTMLYEFCSQPNCVDGTEPIGALTLGTDGLLYGTTSGDGAHGAGGTVFKVAPSGALTTLYSFCGQPGCADGDGPVAALTLGSDGNFYGTTIGGGVTYGTVFKITPSGTLTTLHNFDGSDGYYPLKIIQASDGDFYGTTSLDGPNSSGTVFRVTPGGVFTTLYAFCMQSECADGSNPSGGLVQAASGNFYGTAGGGGLGYGTVFKMTPGGSLTTLHQFESTDGSDPYGGLVQATDGDFYGTTGAGGTGTYGDYGTVFEMTPEGNLRTLYDFCNQSGCTDGAEPIGGLLQATNGILYGTTLQGGADPVAGTVFSLAVGLGPFVEISPSSGKIGQTVTILGGKLKDATSVSFNGLSATFTVRSDTYMTATVPVGATTGTVTVATSSGAFLSNAAFRIRP
jgi:uncharacterized repeat protein (TIGR03803 family)